MQPAKPPHIQPPMQPHLQKLIQLLSKGDLKALLQHYVACNESENLAQLAFVFQQGLKNLAGFEFYQQLASKFIESKGLPLGLIAQMNSADALSFFTPALQLQNNFNKINQQQRNALHYFLLGNQSATSDALPPFNYLRSMMLFESNEVLHEALCQRDLHQLTPVELYLSANRNLTVLPAHEFTALLALIEIESKKQAVNSSNFAAVVKAVKKICADQSKRVSRDLQRLVLIATYYNKPIAQLL